jgi:hypothetical protein
MPLTPEQQAIYDEAMRAPKRDEVREWAAWHEERAAARERETRRRQRAEARTARAMVETADADWNAWAEAHVRRGIDDYREVLLQAVGEVLGELREEFDEKLSALRRELSGKVVDMSERRRA